MSTSTQVGGSQSHEYFHKQDAEAAPVARGATVVGVVDVPPLHGILVRYPLAVPQTLISPRAFTLGQEFAHEAHPSSTSCHCSHSLDQT